MAVGVICEYNPLHTGHLFHLKATREAFPGKTIIALMSGNLVQRGDIAIVDKTARAKMALIGGADLVLEMPLAAACASAGDFARGGVEALVSLGADTISFGSEAGNEEQLLRAADILSSEDFDNRLKRFLSEGFSFATARQRAAEGLAPELSALFETPNNLLAIEYIYAARGRLKPFTIKREGASHDCGRVFCPETPADSGAPSLSASAIRQRLFRGELPPRGSMPDFALEILESELEAGRAPALLEANERVVLAALRRMSPLDFLNIPDCAEGLESRIIKCVKTAKTLSELYDTVKTKRYAHSRIRRIIIRAFFGVTRDLPLIPPYLRLLAVNDAGRKFLKEKKDGMTIITRPSEVKDMSPEARRLFEAEALVTDLWSLFTPEIQPSGAEWRRTPVYLT